jgi:hypothetical protein
MIIKCSEGACNLSSTVKKWHCQCHRPWYSCPVHSSWGTRVKRFQMFCQVSRFPPVHVPQYSMQVPILPGMRRKRTRLGPCRPSTYVSECPVVGGAPFVGWRSSTISLSTKAARRKFDMPSGPGHGRAGSLPSSCSGPRPQDPNKTCNIITPIQLPLMLLPRHVRVEMLTGSGRTMLLLRLFPTI